ncbi:sigma-70 family RNA polymerase sigma factor [Catenovulum sp. 2E275]|uniref:sigma-70 family RNA polymerase sigma factor n=1 Tax=Catenovulum sp. 2E275 TaxID=2980497 RepID=UPI0021D1C9FE|nr:sigma-70 family RNA polymerase sigma factor [Catenovulum sp. 2E275]MCU4675872.1 sigma-70 family RNA polymerase sigma factor [Catenovulum sp. 2E275]
MLKLLKLPFWQTSQVSSHDAMLKFIQTQDASWLETLVHQHQNSLYKFIVQQSNPDLAADICQQAWLKLIEKQYLYSAEHEFKPWLYTIARNLLLDEFRRQNKLILTGDEAIQQADFIEVNNEELESVELGLYRQALSKLAFIHKESLLLQLQGFSLNQISEIVGEPQETVKSRIRYAKQTLKQILLTELNKVQ